MAKPLFIRFNLIIEFNVKLAKANQINLIYNTDWVMNERSWLVCFFKYNKPNNTELTPIQNRVCLHVYSYQLCPTKQWCLYIIINRSLLAERFVDARNSPSRCLAGLRFLVRQMPLCSKCLFAIHSEIHAANHTRQATFGCLCTHTHTECACACCMTCELCLSLSCVCA